MLDFEGRMVAALEQLERPAFADRLKAALDGLPDSISKAATDWIASFARDPETKLTASVLVMSVDGTDAWTLTPERDGAGLMTAAIFMHVPPPQ